MSKLKETQPNPNTRNPKIGRLAVGTAALALATGGAFALRPSHDKNAKSPTVTAGVDTQETGLPPVPSTEVSGANNEVLKDQLAAQAQSMGESYVRQTIELAKLANNGSIFSEMYVQNDGDVNFILHLTKDSGDGTVTTTDMSFVTGVRGDVQDPSLDDFDPSTFKNFGIISTSTTTYEDGAMTGQQLYSLNISPAERDRSGFIVTLGGDEPLIYDTRFPEGSGHVMAMDANVIPKIQGNTDLFIDQAAMPS